MSELILALLAGGTVGITLGALGAGGGIIAVPALVYLLGFTPAEATTASLLIVSVTSLTALYAHARTGAVQWRGGLLLAAAGVLPAAIAGVLAARVPAALLTAAFGLVAGLAGLRMLRPAPPATAPATATAVQPVKAVSAGAGLGALTGLLGVGGGFLAVPALTGVLAFRIRAAVATSLLVVSVNALVALAARGGTATGVDWAVVGPFAAAAVLGAWDGKRLGAKLPDAVLHRVFAGVLLAVAVLMLVDAAR
ncbi:sulfite exporter TauE/SafE family protein [Streptomyces sp. NPDC127068]|uniref:sulfite exporter TauE/SafE family protein n=1 Tax=Streptomyces sp. NPDC127068 TaxID=3347127 RepID=UPI0036526B94